MRRPIFVLALVLTAALAPIACGSDPAPTAPTETPVAITEAFSGQLTRNGGITHTFVVQRAGTAAATLTSLAPDSAAVVGLAIGTFNGQSCAQTIINEKATTATSVVGTASSAGTFCVRIYDADGTLAQPTDYSISVTHF